MGVGATVITVTTGAGRCCGASSLEQPVANSAQRPRIATRITTLSAFSILGHGCMDSRSFVPDADCRASAQAAIGLWSNRTPLRSPVDLNAAFESSDAPFDVDQTGGFRDESRRYTYGALLISSAKAATLA